MMIGMFSNVRTSGADMSDIDSNFQTYRNDTLDRVNFRQARLAFCDFSGTKLQKAIFENTMLIGAQFTSGSNLTEADFEGAFLFLASIDDHQLTASDLKSLGARNVDKAIITLDDLTRMIEENEIAPSLAQHYQKYITELYYGLKSVPADAELSSFELTEPTDRIIVSATKSTLQSLYDAYAILERATMFEQSCALAVAV